mmetsp:Transcript_16121/g.30450  ORF Transcript_16121/g.30450 Transcript_16121/m.30450 type:complete len:115 (+) Transcript_16121:3606-3950(+)
MRMLKRPLKGKSALVVHLIGSGTAEFIRLNIAIAKGRPYVRRKADKYKTTCKIVSRRSNLATRSTWISLILALPATAGTLSIVRNILSLVTTCQTIVIRNVSAKKMQRQGMAIG